jgi:YggT family protein
MILLGNFLIALGQLVNGVLSIFIFLMFARVVISWVSADPRNGLVQFIYGATEPILVRVRSKIPPIGMFDFSVIAVILAIYFLQQFLGGSLISYGARFLGANF